eukprot:scaffold13063_cov115-Skeletonema_dohrnii-CCMP3373.AAC.2
MAKYGAILSKVSAHVGAARHRLFKPPLPERPILALKGMSVSQSQRLLQQLPPSCRKLANVHRCGANWQNCTALLGIENRPLIISSASSSLPKDHIHATGALATHINEGNTQCTPSYIVEQKSLPNFLLI